MSLDLSAYRPPPHPKGVRLSGDHVILVPIDAKAHGPALFAAIDKDWHHLKQAFLQYLSDDNFDRDGAPLTSLSTLTSPLLFKTDDNILLRG